MFSDIKITYLAPGVFTISGSCAPPPVDVDFIDVTDSSITDPARLLPYRSVTPFWVENRRRYQQFKKLCLLVNRIKDLVGQYEDFLHLPIGLNHCPEKWENQLSDIVWDAFSEMHEAVDDAISAFYEKFHHAAWLLYECHGFTAEEFRAHMAGEAKAKHSAELHSAFIHDLESKYNPIDDDLPF